jgi:hypothetical protein
MSASLEVSDELCIIELDALTGRDELSGYDVLSLIPYP